MERSTELYNLFLQGNTDALEQLVVAYGDNLMRYAYCYLRDFFAAEDVMEDTFANLIVKRKKFAERAPFEAYLFKIARNKCIDRLRRRRRETVLPVGVHFREDAHVEEEALKSVRNEKVYKAMVTLTQDYRSVLYLMYYQSFTVDEIRLALGKTKKQVYNLLSRAKAALKEILIQEGIGYEDL